MRIGLNYPVLAIFALFMAAVTQAHAQQAGAVTVATCGASSYSAGQIYPLSQTQTGNLCDSGGGGGGTSSVNPAVNTAGTRSPLAVDANNALIPPTVGASGPVITKTNISANTNTTICPATGASYPISEEIFFTTAGVGISLGGATLTTATIGTATTTPDLSFAAANTLYTLPVPRNNAITAYGAAGIVVCIQNIRQ